MSKSQIVQEVETANAKYVASFGEKGKLALPPGRRFAVLTCMDARLDPAKYAGLAEGDAHVIRNAGGRASDDAIRSLVISYKLLGTKEFFVVHHTDCGMVLFNSEIMGGLLEKSPFINRTLTNEPRSLITDTKTHIRPTHPTELPSSIMADQNASPKRTTTPPPNVLSHLNSSTMQTESAQFVSPQFRNRSPYGIANQRR